MDKNFLNIIDEEIGSNNINNKGDKVYIDLLSTVINNTMFCICSLAYIDVLKEEYRKCAQRFYTSMNKEDAVIKFSKSYVYENIKQIIYEKYKQSIDVVLSFRKNVTGKDTGYSFVEEKINEFIETCLLINEKGFIINVYEEFVTYKFFVYVCNLFEITSSLSAQLIRFISYATTIHTEIVDLYKKLLINTLEFAKQLSNDFILDIKNINKKQIIYSKILKSFDGKKIKKYISEKDKDSKISEAIKKLNIILSILLHPEEPTPDFSFLKRNVLTDESFINEFLIKLSLVYDTFVVYNYNKPVYIDKHNIATTVLIHILDIFKESVKNFNIIEIEKMHSSGKYVYPVFESDILKYYNNSENNRKRVGINVSNLTVLMFVNRDVYKEKKIVYIPSFDYDAIIDYLTNKIKETEKNYKESELRKIIKECVDEVLKYRKVSPRAYSNEVKKMAKVDDKKKVAVLNGYELVAIDMSEIIEMDEEKIIDSALSGIRDAEKEKKDAEELKSAEESIAKLTGESKEEKDE